MSHAIFDAWRGDSGGEEEVCLFAVEVKNMATYNIAIPVKRPLPTLLLLSAINMAYVEEYVYVYLDSR